MGHEKVKVGILVDDHYLPKWAYCMVDRINECRGVELAFFIVSSSAAPVHQKRKQSIIRRALLTAQNKLVGSHGYVENAFEKRAISELGAEVAVADLRTSDPSAAERVSILQNTDGIPFDVDVLIHVAETNINNEVLRAARCGVWSIEIGRAPVADGMPSGYWEVLESHVTTRSVLKIRTSEHEQGYIAYESFASTNVGSFIDNASEILWKSLHFVPRKLRELQLVGWGEFLSRLRSNADEFSDERSDPVKRLSNRRLAWLLWRKFLEKLSRKWYDVFYFKQWFLLYDFGPAEPCDCRRFKRILPPNDRFWADPFIILRDGRHYVFFEECLEPNGKGFISVMELSSNGIRQPPRPVLKKPYHLSYPFLFEADNELYMIPESYENRTVELYKCKSFPADWEFQKNLMENCLLVDSTLVSWEGRWWLFANGVADDNASTWDELHVFFSDSPFSTEWTAHPKNPVVSDVRAARPAGRIVVRNGRMFRPSQNNSKHYGYSLNACEITRLTVTEYEEVIVSAIEPGWAEDIISVHTINHESGLTMIDAQILQRKRNRFLGS